jgi:hypothetical protein
MRSALVPSRTRSAVSSTRRSLSAGRSAIAAATPARRSDPMSSSVRAVADAGGSSRSLNRPARWNESAAPRFAHDVPEPRRAQHSSGVKSARARHFGGVTPLNHLKPSERT